MLTLGVNSKPKLSDEVFKNLKDLIYDRCGISFGPTKKYLLESRLTKRLELKGLKSFDEYLYYLQYDPSRESEISVLLNTIVTNETSFFRDPSQLDAFGAGVVPRIVEERGNGAGKALRVWSAACSTGEEPLALAMMLHDAGLPMKGWMVEVLGSDISDNVLETAKKAVYEKYTLRNATEECLNKHFTAEGEKYSVKPHLQKMVRYRKINLMSSFETRLIKNIDVIFCRNVLIYFDDASKKKVVSNLYDSLSKGGYLFVGFSESLHSVTRLFRPVSIKGSMVYQKM